MTRKLPRTAYAKWVAHRLVDKNMTQKELAEQTGIRQPNLCQCFSGLRPGRKYRPLIERVLGPPPPEVEKAS